jgi:ferritin-like metal-binding protein YciE
MAKTERSGHTTTNHDFIRQWVEERGGWPARVVGTGAENDAGLIRIDFPGFSGEGSLERIEWEEWFEGFEENQLAFLHRDMDHGGGDLDRFNKLISRGDDDGDEEGEGEERTRGGSAKTGGGSAGKSSSARKSSSSAKSPSARKSASDGKSSSAGESASARKSASGGKAGGASARGSASTTAETGAKASGKTSGGSRQADGAGNTEMRGLLLHDLGDLLSAERQFLVTTRALAREAQDPEVRTRAEEHVAETEGQIQRLNEAFAALGERPRAVRCEAAAGLKEEHDSYKREEKPSKQLLSAFGLGSGLRVEHYEIAAYRSAIAVAGALGEKECAQLLNESLREEMAMASFLEKTSRTLLKRMAAGESDGEGGASSGRSGSSAAKRASTSGKGGSSAARGASAGGSRGRGGASA